MSIILDSYDESNRNSGFATYSLMLRRAQSFDASAGDASGGVLDKASFFLQKAGSPTGNVYAELWSHTGTYGTSSRGLALLATSDAVDVSTVAGAYALMDFTFSGAQKYELADATKYVIACSYPGGDGSNHVLVGSDTTSPLHGGNHTYYDTSAWGGSASWDLAGFYVYIDSVASPGAGLVLLNI